MGCFALMALSQKPWGSSFVQHIGTMSTPQEELRLHGGCATPTWQISVMEGGKTEESPVRL